MNNALNLPVGEKERFTQANLSLATKLVPQPGFSGEEGG